VRGLAAVILPRYNGWCMTRDPQTLRSFKPFVDAHSKILILGTMPGPVALKKQEYYGFKSNHFWKIIFKLLSVEEIQDYSKKKKLLKENGIALWDVFKACERKGALDSRIRCAEYNDIPKLLKQHPKIKAVFLNSRTAENVFKERFAQSVPIPAYYLPSTSPAHASLSFNQKLRAWSKIIKFL
jgi:hypoxanthine-DNA glycosylase